MIPSYLAALAQCKKPIRIAICGCGWFGGGAFSEMLRRDKIHPWLVINRSLSKVKKRLQNANVPEENIHIIESDQDIPQTPLEDHYYLAKNWEVIKLAAENIDVLLEAVGDTLVSAKVIDLSIRSKIDTITASAEVLSLIGVPFQRLAEQEGVQFTIVDGDQPGCLARMLDEVTVLGYTPVIIGNVKGFLDLHQNPKGVLPFVPKGQSVEKICMYADGTKQAMELGLVANMFGYDIAKRGCLGITTTKEKIIADFAKVSKNKKLSAPIVDYVLGINGVDQGGGVFVVVTHPDKNIQADMKYLKKGDGPQYLMFRDHHLCYFEAIRTVLDLKLFNTRVAVPVVQNIDVVAMAKRSLKSGMHLDGLGGYDCYGLVEKTARMLKRNYLPMLLVEFATTKAKVAKDTPLTYDNVDLEDNLVVRMRLDFEKELRREIKK